MNGPDIFLVFGLFYCPLILKILPLFKVKLQEGECKNNMRYLVTELGHTLSHRVLLPSSLELNQCVGKCDLIHGIDGDIPMTNQARMRLLRYAEQCYHFNLRGHFFKTIPYSFPTISDVKLCVLLVYSLSAVIVKKKYSNCVKKILKARKD